MKVRLLLLIVLSASSVRQVRAQKPPPLHSALAEAAASGDAAAFDALIQKNRLSVKPAFTEAQISYLNSRIAHDSARSEDLAIVLKRMASSFERIFAERALSIRFDLLRSWSGEQLETKRMADSLFEAGDSIRRDTDRRSEAFDLFSESNTLYEKIDDVAGQAQALGRLGFVSWYLDRPAYLSFNSRALELRRAVDDRQLIGNTLNDIGIYHLAISRDYSRALNSFLDSESVREEIGDTASLAGLLPRIGRSYEGLGDYSNAQAYYLKASDLYAAVGDAARSIRQRNNAAGILTDFLGRHSEALSIFLDLEQELEEINDPRTRALVFNSLGVVNRRLGDYEEAILQYREVVKIAEQNGFDDLLAQALNNIGVVYIWVDRPERAIPMLQRAEQVFGSVDLREGIVDALQNMGTAYFDMGDFATSDSSLSEAAALSDSLADPVRTATILTARGNTRLRNTGPEAARPDYDTALGIAQTLEIPDLIMGTLFGLGEVAERSGDADGALALYEQGFESIEQARGLLRAEEDKAGYLAQSRYLYEEAIHFMTKQAIATGDESWAETAFRFTERSKARAFLDQISESLAGVREGVDPELLSDQQILTENLATLRSQLSGLNPRTDRDRINELKAVMREQEREFKRVERDLRDRNPRYAALQYPEPVGAESVQEQLLGPDDLLLQYSVGDSSSTLWAISRSAMHLYRLPPRDELEQQIDLIRFSLTNPDQGSVGSFSGPARRLYRDLLEPASTEIADAKNLIIIPDDVLHYVPFETLLTDRPQPDASYSDLPYLIRNHGVVYEQSASVLAQIIADSDPTGGSAFLAVGDPTFSGAPEGSRLRSASLAPLPFSGTEVTRIASLFDTDETRVLTQNAATESGLKAALASGSYRFVHFATHGLINDDRPDYSALAFSADDEDNDGFLFASEIFNMKVNADMVVLSACETGLGQLVRGEGVIGLTRAFMYAGARSLVVSLWSVSDSSTSELMQSLYRGLVRDSMTKTGALRAAKLDLIGSDTTAHPFYWAPFVLVGRGE